MKVLAVSLLALASAVCAAKSGPTCAVYVHVDNAHVPLNAARYQLEDGAPVFDLVSLIAARIGFDDEGDITIRHSPMLQAVLDHADQQIRPLQEMGMSVVLSVRQGHDGVDAASLPTPAAATQLAARIRAVVDQYGLDGVDIGHNETYSSVPGQLPINPHSVAWLVAALRKEMPEKLISVLNIVPIYLQLTKEDPIVGQNLDFAWSPWFGYCAGYAEPSIPGISKQKYAEGTVSFPRNSHLQVMLCAGTIRHGYGAFLMDNLIDGDHSQWISKFTEPLYGQQAIYRPPNQHGESSQNDELKH